MRSLLNTDLGIARKGCASGTARGPWGCGDAVLGRARTRHPGTANPFLPFPRLSTAGPALPRPFLPLPAGRCFSCQQSGLDVPPSSSEGRGSSLQRGRKSCWQSKARGAQGSRRGFGRAGLPLLRTLAQVKQRAELTGSSYPRLLPAHPINHTPNEFVFTDEMFLAAETSRRLYLPLIVSSRSDNLYQEMVLNFQFRSRWGSRLGTCRYSFGSDDCNDLGDIFSLCSQFYTHLHLPGSESSSPAMLEAASVTVGARHRWRAGHKPAFPLSREGAAGGGSEGT